MNVLHAVYEKIIFISIFLKYPRLLIMAGILALTASPYRKSGMPRPCQLMKNPLCSYIMTIPPPNLIGDFRVSW